MSYSQITQNALAYSLKKLMLIKPLNKITVQEVADDCGVTRHTFYNHYQDIYELLGWIYEREIITDLKQYQNYEGWETGYLLVLQYIQNNKVFCLNTFHSLGREHLERFLYKVIYDVMNGVVEELSENMDIDEQAKNEVADFYTWAVLAQSFQWLKQNATIEPNEMAIKVSSIMKGNVRRSLENVSHKNAKRT